MTILIIDGMVFYETTRILFWLVNIHNYKPFAMNEWYLIFYKMH